MKLGGWKSATRRQRIIIASVGAALAIGGAGVAIAVSVSAHNAAAEQAAAEAIAAKNAEEEEAARAEAARLTAARDDAVSKASEGEALLTDSEMWGDPDAREELRDALGVLVALQADESASAEALEAAASSVTRAGVRVGRPPAPITLVCGNLDAGVSYDNRELVLNPDGSGQFDDLWAGQYRCDEGFSTTTVSTQVTVKTALQRAAVAAARAAGYDEYHSTEGAILYAVYEGCAGSGTGGFYGRLDSLSPAQAADTRVWLTLCPNHPDAETWRAKSAEGDAIREAESNGTRVAPGGSYEVPGQMVRGTFVAENVSDCYWETRDSNGNIVDNNFVIAAPRVVAEVGDTAVVFTTQGGCGYWNRQ